MGWAVPVTARSVGCRLQPHESSCNAGQTRTVAVPISATPLKCVHAPLQTLPYKTERHSIGVVRLVALTPIPTLGVLDRSISVSVFLKISVASAIFQGVTP